MDKTSNLKPKEIETFSKIINEYIASQTSSSLSTLLSEPITYKVMILDKRFFNPGNIKLSSDELQMCGVHAAQQNPLFYPKGKGQLTGGRLGLDKNKDIMNTHGL